MATSRLMRGIEEQPTPAAKCAIARHPWRHGHAACVPRLRRRGRRRWRRGWRGGTGLIALVACASGWTRLESSTTQRARGGSIQIEQPVKPRWPTPSLGHARPPTSPSATGGPSRGTRSSRGPPTESIVGARASTARGAGSRSSATPCQAATSACTMRETSRAVEKRPAWPATPPMARAFSSWTMPRSSPSVGAQRGGVARAEASCRCRAAARCDARKRRRAFRRARCSTVAPSRMKPRSL